MLRRPTRVGGGQHPDCQTFRLAAAFTGVNIKLRANPPQPSLLGDGAGCSDCCCSAASAPGRTYGPGLAALFLPLLAGPPACLASSAASMESNAPSMLV